MPSRGDSSCSPRLQPILWREKPRAISMSRCRSAQGGTTALTFEAALTRIYDTPTVTVNANAVEATHGETTMEILGSGDATNDALEFQLKQSPLTYVSAPTAQACNRRCRCG